MTWRKLSQIDAGARSAPAVASSDHPTRTVTDGLSTSVKTKPPNDAHASFHYGRHRWLGLAARDALLTGGTLRVAIYLWEHQNAERGCAWPALETMAGDLSLNKSTVMRAIKSLKNRGRINIRHRGGRFRSNEYRLTFGLMEDDVPAEK